MLKNPQKSVDCQITNLKHQRSIQKKEFVNKKQLIISRISSNQKSASRKNWKKLGRPELEAEFDLEYGKPKNIPSNASRLECFEAMFDDRMYNAWMEYTTTESRPGYIFKYPFDKDSQRAFLGVKLALMAHHETVDDGYRYN